MATLTSYDSQLLAGPLGNCRIEFDGVYLGKTTEDTTLTKDEDTKEIIYSQSGTKADDHVSTGMLLNLSATFGEISTELLERVLYSFSSQASADPASGTFGRYIYKSLKDNKAKVLKIHATDEDGAALTSDEDVICCYQAVPLIEENLINWGADTQRNLPVNFQIYYKEFGDEQVSGGPAGAFAYYGDPATELVPATSVF